MGWTKINSKTLEYATYPNINNDLSLLSQFIKDNDIVSYREDIGFGTTVRRFFENGGRACGNNELDVRRFFGCTIIDHFMFFKTKSGHIILTSHPYVDVKTIVDEFTSRFSEDFTIEVFESDKSWYNRGQSVLVVIRLKSFYEK